MEPTMVDCACGCGERFYGYNGEYWSQECEPVPRWLDFVPKRGNADT
jgi:glutathione S-transferase